MKAKLFSRLFLIVVVLFVANLACSAVTSIVDGGISHEESMDVSSHEDEDTDENVQVYENSDEMDSSDSSDAIEDSDSLPSGRTCPNVAANILWAAMQFTNDPNVETGEDVESDVIVSYVVTGDQISDPYYEKVSDELQSYQDDTSAHQQIWDYFITLIPLKERESILVEYTIVTDGKDNNLAAVSQTVTTPELWMLEVDIADANDKRNLTYTLIHEYAHLLTLGPDQVTPSMAVFKNPGDEDVYYDESSTCAQYFPGEGCSKPNSYINAYFNQFWVDIHEEYQDINLIEDDDAYYEALDDFYFKYEDRFITEYAVTNPEEDIAESFTFFILSQRPAGNSIAEEKILFFYNYPDLVQLRDTVLQGVCQLN